jgi:hypothetical protein
MGKTIVDDFLGSGDFGIRLTGKEAMTPLRPGRGKRSVSSPCMLVALSTRENRVYDYLARFNSE